MTSNQLPVGTQRSTLAALWAMPIPAARQASCIRIEWRTVTELVQIDFTELIHSEVLPAHPEQIGQVRRIVERLVGDHPLSGTIVLLADELASNAVKHSGSRLFALVVARRPEHGIRIAVIDEGLAGLPALRNASPDGTCGRGLLLVARLAQLWGITRNPDAGTAVWCDIS